MAHNKTPKNPDPVGFLEKPGLNSMPGVSCLHIGLIKE